MCAHAAYFWGGSLQLAADSVQVEQVERNDGGRYGNCSHLTGLCSSHRSPIGRQCHRHTLVNHRIASSLLNKSRQITTVPCHTLLKQGFASILNQSLIPAPPLAYLRLPISRHVDVIKMLALYASISTWRNYDSALLV